MSAGGRPNPGGGDRAGGEGVCGGGGGGGAGGIIPIHREDFKGELTISRLGTGNLS